MNLNHLRPDSALKSFSRRGDETTIRPNYGFDDLGIAPSLLKEISRLNFTTPTPVQNEAIPAGLNGDDIIAIAKTGSGKTIAYGIPMLQRLSKSKRGTGLVLVPTRELAIQVEEAIQSVSRTINIRSAVLIGGASMIQQLRALEKKPRIIIATPGRLLDHVERKTVSLAEVEVFILDEADRMLDMGFIPDIKKIMKSIPDKRQTMLFSATMPQEIEAIAGELMANPTHIEIDRSGTTPAEVSHEMFFINNQDKSRLLALQLKQCSGPVLVFTRTKRMASKLTNKVKKMGFAAAEIHSDRSQGQRQHAMEGFKRGRYQILIATDIAARGIDVSGIELVVNYDMPANSEDYVHRIGRTGRAGKTGHAISFANIAQRSSILSLERFMKTKLTISALPILPSEKLLIQEAELLKVKEEPSRDEKSSTRKYIKKTPIKRKDFKRSSSKKNPAERMESKKKDSGSKDSKAKKTKPDKSQLADTAQKDSGDESSFWSIFKKNRLSIKKSVGQGNRRKKRPKNK